MDTKSKAKAKQKKYMQRWFQANKERLREQRREYLRKYREEHRAELSAYQKNWKAQHNKQKAANDRRYQKAHPRTEEQKVRYRANLRTALRNFRIEVISAYGGKCTCECGCDVTDPDVLELDHTHNDGKEDRNRKGSHHGVLLRLKQAGYPKDRIRILCRRCHRRRHFLGSCLHGSV